MTAAEQRDIDRGFLPGETSGSGIWGSPDYNWQSADYVPGPSPVILRTASRAAGGGFLSLLSANVGWAIGALVVALLLIGRGRN